MRIAICTECYVPEVNGVVYHINTLCEGLKEAGHEVLIVKPDFKSKEYTIENDILTSPAIKLRRMYDYSFAYPKSRKRLKLLKDWKPDVLHIHNEYSQGLFAIYASKKLGIPVVYTIHTMYYDYLHYLGIFERLKITKKFVDSFLKKFVNASEAVICASRKLEKFMTRLTTTQPIHMIPNTCIVKDFDYKTLDQNTFKELKEKYKVNSENLNVCFCGRLAAEKNLNKMLKIWKEILPDLPKAKLIIIGDGPDKKALENKAKSMGLEESVVFTGKIHHDYIKYYYHMCNAYFMVSTSENHSISALEATACGLPIIHLYDEQNEYQYIEGLTGFAFHDNEELKKIFKKIEKLTKSDTSNNDFKDTLIQKASESDYRQATEKIIAVYNQSIESYKKKQKN